MKLRLLEYIRCPACRATFDLLDAVADEGEVSDATLRCRGCGSSYAVTEGVPRMREMALAAPDATKPRTAASFGYIWGLSPVGTEESQPASYHFAKMETALSLPPPHGLVLDAGCGDGIDLVNQARRPGVEVIGVDLSDGGVRTSFHRSRGLANAHVVQADLCRLPFDAGTFDLAYSYGVLHHLGVPDEGLREVVRVVKPEHPVVAYLYEDFTEREAVWRWLLAVANSFRGLTTRLPHRVLYGFCWIAAPVVHIFFTVPSKVFRRIPALASIGATFPYQHGTGPFSMVGDLYDRLSAPVEYRYTRSGTLEFFRRAGLQSLRIARDRGWIVTGVKPSGSAADRPAVSAAVPDA